MKAESYKKNKYEQSKQSRICDCWLDCGQCYCVIPKKEEDESK